MPWTYVQKSGVLLDPDYKYAGTGYSGNGKGLNNPLMQKVRGIGPIPCGRWAIVGEPFDDDKMGRFVIRLKWMGDKLPFGRDGFCIHGDNYRHNKSASQGCPIFPPKVRQAIVDSGDRVFEVVSGLHK